MEGVSSTPERQHRIITALLILAAVWLVYGWSLNAPFIFDDHDSVLRNPTIRQLSAVGQVLHPPRYSPTAGRPLVNISLAINYQLGGLNPFGYHLLNVALHALCALLVWAIVGRTLALPRFNFGRAGPVLAAIVGLIWAVHPLNSEAVIYITQRTELMMGLFYLATLYAALRYWQAEDCDIRVPHPRAGVPDDPHGRHAAVAPEQIQASGKSVAKWGWLIAAALACAAGMMCKEVMVSAPLAVLLYQRTFMGASWKQMRNSWPLYVAVGAGWLVLLALNIGGPRSISAGFGLNVPIIDWWLSQCRVLLMYLKLVVWPWPLLLHYKAVYLSGVLPVIVYSGAVLLLIGVAAVGLWRRWTVGFVAAWMLMILAPTSLVPIITEAAAERRMYLPLAAIAALLVVAGYQLLRRINLKLASVGAMGLLLVLVLALVNLHRLAMYRDPVLLWQDLIQHQPDNDVACNNLGAIWQDRGDQRKAREMFEQALQINPNFAMAHNNLGSLLADQGRYDQAIEQYRVALQNEPTLALAESNWGAALAKLGKPDEAIAHYDQALRLDPYNVDANYNMAVRLLHLGQTEQAIEHLQIVLRMKSDDVDANINMGMALVRLGHDEQAITYYQRAIAKDPQVTQAWVNLAQAYVNLDRMDDALAAARKAYELARAQGDTALAERLGKLLSPGDKDSGAGP